MTMWAFCMMPSHIVVWFCIAWRHGQWRHGRRSRSTQTTAPSPRAACSTMAPYLGRMTFGSTLWRILENNSFCAKVLEKGRTDLFSHTTLNAWSFFFFWQCDPFARSTPSTLRHGCIARCHGLGSHGIGSGSTCRRRRPHPGLDAGPWRPTRGVLQRNHGRVAWDVMQKELVCEKFR
jgi:hypothetical protein